jgi:hypothetical protein
VVETGQWQRQVLLHSRPSRAGEEWELAELHPCQPQQQQKPGVRIALAPQQGCKVFTLQTLPACDEPFDDPVGKVAGFSLAQATLSPRPGSHLVNAGVAAKAQERKNLERLCGYISRPPVSEIH